MKEGGGHPIDHEGERVCANIVHGSRDKIMTTVDGLTKVWGITNSPYQRHLRSQIWIVRLFVTLYEWNGDLYG